jgi:chemotaxis protein histidine kinase CheA
LFITKNQIDAMGGNITVESEPNVGTTFKIYYSMTKKSIWVMMMMLFIKL